MQVTHLGYGRALKSGARESRLGTERRTPTGSGGRSSSSPPKPQCAWDKLEKTERNAWWMSTIRDTPAPGTYDHQDFLSEKERNPVRTTYCFKNEGRRRQNWVVHEGKLLMPGAYNHQDFSYNLERMNTSYGFKDGERFNKDQLTKGLIDKDLDLAPNQYNVENHLGIDQEKLPSKHNAFRSRVRRLPSKEFEARDGPGPGKYDALTAQSAPPVRSSFQSRAPRFVTSHTKNPGPGHYEKTYQSPMPATIAKMGRQHGLFFSSAFYT